ncbi:MAG: hypothetical protein ABIO94_13790 [Opitutaceae bacterium]
MKPIATVVSLLANAALLAMFLWRPALLPEPMRKFFQRDSGSVIADAKHVVAPANSVAPAATPPDLSALLATEDLHVLIARLRAAGFPNNAIRAIIETKLSERYDMVRLRALVSADAPDAPFWKARSPGGIGQRLNEYMQALSERGRVMRELLGAFATSDDGEPTFEQRRQYGSLPQAKIDQIERINADYAEMDRGRKAVINGIILPEDREKLAVLEREKRADLVAILSPEELEEYDMRNSPITTRLRPALTLFKVTEDEFRTIYQVQKDFGDRIDITSNRLAAMTPDERTAFMQQRPIAQAELDAQMRAALGDQRYAEFARSSDNDYRQLVRLAERENLPVQTALQVYNFRSQVAPESVRISSDPTLSPEQKVAALQSLLQTTRAQLVATLGETAGITYGKTATWVSNIERSAAMIRAQAARTPVAPSPAR